MIDINNKIIFIHIPKCAGSSIEKFILLSNKEKNNDIDPTKMNHKYLIGKIDVNFNRKNNIKFNFATNKYKYICPNHYNIHDFIKLNYNLSNFNTFAIVRDPLSRFI